MREDYEKWYQENEEFFSHLYHHDSIIFERMADIIGVLNHILQLEEHDIDADLEVFFDVGYAYLFNRVEEIKLYLMKYFKNDLHHFLDYEVVLNYYFYLDDLKDTLLQDENYTESIQDEFDSMQEEIIQLMESHKKFDVSIIDVFNNRLLSVIPSKKEYLTTPEIFTRALEELEN